MVPLLFVIAAEHSLAERLAALEAIEAAYDAALENGDSLAPHVSQILPPKIDNWREGLAAEEESLNWSDVMGEALEETVGLSANPLLLYLERQASDLAPSAVADVGARDLGSYRIADDTLQHMTGIRGDDPDSVDRRRRIQVGEIDLRVVQLPEGRRGVIYELRK